MRYGLLGEKLGHSFSPQLHKALAGYDYELLPTPREELNTLLERRDFSGLNVTIPYKQAVIPLCDEIDGKAAEIGAVNTVVNRNGRLIGYNTDFDGLLYMARRAGVELSGKKVLILGSGGTSRTAHAAAAALGAKTITVISRTGADNYDSLHRHSDAQIIINTTPVGMFPNCGVSPVDLDAFPQLTGLLDVVYNPLRTALFMQAEARGIPCSCGLPMLVSQARKAAELFTGEKISDRRMEDVLSALTGQLQNIILIGMPGSGKTTVGSALARQLGRRFIDLDTVIEQRAGRSIPQIFAEDGETAFRVLEHQCVREVGAENGAVISTGGGVVTRADNFAPLHQNGVILHLVRDLSRLPTDGRPVSQTVDAETLWQRRKALYAGFSDRTIDNNGTLDQTLALIQKELNET